MLKAEIWGQLIESAGLGGSLTADAELAGSIGSGVEKVNVSKTLQADVMSCRPPARATQYIL
nr:MAG TPA: hypothetical protein [Caudoviricetes sp.]